MEKVIFNASSITPENSSGSVFIHSVNMLGSFQDCVITSSYMAFLFNSSKIYSDETVGFTFDNLTITDS